MAGAQAAWVIDYPTTGDWRSAAKNKEDAVPLTPPSNKRPQVNPAAIVENKTPGSDPGLHHRAAKELDMSRSTKRRRHPRRTTSFKVGIDGHPGVALRDVEEAARAALSIQRIQPQQRKGR